MPLRSKLLKDDQKLQQCLVQDSAHVQLGAIGKHVTKIQVALSVLAEDGDAGIPGPELKAAYYGPKTADAVLLFKTRRDIVNRSYESHADKIVGKMTIAALDEEVFDEENFASGLTNPLVDPDEKNRIQVLIIKHRPGVLRMLISTLKSLNEVKHALELHMEDPAQSLPLEAKNQFAIDGLRRFFGLTTLFASSQTSRDEELLQAIDRIIANYEAYKTNYPRLPGNQRAADFPILLRDHPDEAQLLLNPNGNQHPAFTVEGEAMFFVPSYRERNPAMPLPFKGFFSETLHAQQLHEMGHFYFGFKDGDPRGTPTDVCLKLANSYNFLAEQIEFHHKVR
jgi:hypothetical protein